MLWRLLGCAVAVTVADQDISATLSGRTLFTLARKSCGRFGKKKSHLSIVVCVSWTPAPSTNADICPSVCKGSDELLQFRKVLGRIDSPHHPVVDVHTVAQAMEDGQ
jgi:hypothetical protein